jgi:hypothetical protein
VANMEKGIAQRVQEINMKQNNTLNTNIINNQRIKQKKP